MRTPFFCICENKDADQLRCVREADQRLSFGYTDSTIPLNFKPLAYSPVCVRHGQKPQRPVFSHRGSNHRKLILAIMACTI